MEFLLKSRLQERRRRIIEDAHLTTAAVLLPLFNQDNACHLLFIQRSKEVAHHKGEISFPGGVCEEGDGSLVRTALREAHEEIGLIPEDVRVIGLLDDMQTLSTRYRVTPVVGIIPYPYPFAPNAREVEHIITAPIAHFLDAGNGGEESVTRDGKIYRGHVYRYKSHLIWGATARILKDFLKLWNDLFPA